MATRQSNKMRLVVCIMASCLLAAAQAGNILVLTTPRGNSHTMNLRRIVEEAVQRGHQIMYVTIAADASFPQPTSMPIITYHIHGMKDGDMMPDFRAAANVPWKKMWTGYYEIIKGACKGLLGNETAMNHLKDFKAEVMLAENFSPISALLAHKLELPWISLWPAAPVEPFMTSPWSYSNRRMFQPNPLSYYPQYFMRSTTQHMGLFKRLENILSYWTWTYRDWAIHRATIMELYKSFNFNPDLPEERRRLVLSMAPVDWAAEWLRPVTPNFKMVGPILAGPGKALPAHIEAFMRDAGKQGVLLVSLSTIAELEPEQLVGMAAVFAKLPCKVLWRLKPREVPDADALARLQLGNNTQVLTWVPQNDVIAHSNLRAFLSHAGINSMYEAVYHGKPILAMPFFGDQPSNADRAVAKGFGQHIRTDQAGTPAFQKALMAVLTDPRYTQAAQAMSVKIRARKNTPVQEAADWVEHVIDTKGEPYLKTPEDELSFIVPMARYDAQEKDQLEHDTFQIWTALFGNIEAR